MGKNLILLAWRNLWRNKRRSLITIASVLFAVFFAVLLRSFQLGAYALMIDNIVSSVTGYVQVHTPAFADESTLNNSLELTPELRQKLLSQDGVADILPRLESFVLISSGEQTKGVAIVGIDPDGETGPMNLEAMLDAGRIFSADEDAVLLGEGMARFFNVNPGDTLIFLGQGFRGMSATGKYPVAGIVKLSNPELNKNLVLLPLKTAQELFAAYDRATSIIVLPKNPQEYKELTTGLQNTLSGNGLTARHWEEIMPEIKQAIEADSLGGKLFLGVLYIIITFGLFGTVLMMTAERVREFGILLSIGMKRKLLATVTFLESLLLGFTGSVLGALLVRPLVLYFNHRPLRLLGQAGDALEEYGFEPVLPTTTDWAITFTHMGIVLLMATVCSIYAVVFLFKLKPINALKS